MRSLLRFVLTFFSSVVVASCLLNILFPYPSDSETTPHHDTEETGHSSWFSLRDPTSLFSPTATISLTDDNSTFFNAKPAAFGPLLPSKGLSGQIWVGSGFGDDNINRRGMASSEEGELGCGDIPGWSDRDWISSQHFGASLLKVTTRLGQRSPVSGKSHQDAPDLTGKAVSQEVEDDEQDDGTDDHLQHHLPATSVAKSNGKQLHPPMEQHADIQSLQEAAEIQGRIVLLSRGGCGFSEKVKWAQRRGAVAVIVADNVRGGPLVRMYARSDVSNITIPSLFTSHTTAHLLSHLIPAMSKTDAEARPESGKKLTAVPSLKQTSPAATSNSWSSENVSSDLEAASDASRDDQTDCGNEGQLRPCDGGLLSALGVPIKETSRESSKHKPDEPTSRNWLRVIHPGKDDAWYAHSMKPAQPFSGSSDGFKIGVQDWRDPDVLRIGAATRSSSSTSSTRTASRFSSTNTHLKGGSITPGSGEYARPGGNLVETQESHNALMYGHGPGKPKRRSWLPRLFSSSSAGSEEASNSSRRPSYTTSAHSASGAAASYFEGGAMDDGPEQHIGLWVTLTPTDMNTGPFFNTLFVLVVSPMITLAIVYSMLLLRSRIRRHRWRAPKSVVERLPVRVYQVLSSRSSMIEDDSEGTATATTPLLAGSRPTDIPPRARSRASSAEAASSNPIRQTVGYGSLGSVTTEQEKTASGLAEWKRKYGGKQRECVVCLEEYVDGVSRVMSLPCGHEFHVDCITPWLTTRRRTCPICKGDVVRSLARSGNATSEDRPADLDEEEIQQQAAERTNPSPSAGLPIPGALASDQEDVERADGPDAQHPATDAVSSSWLSRSFSRGLDYFGVQHHDRDQPPLDRNR